MIYKLSKFITKDIHTCIIIFKEHIPFTEKKLGTGYERKNGILRKKKRNKGTESASMLVSVILLNIFTVRVYKMTCSVKRRKI